MTHCIARVAERVHLPKMYCVWIIPVKATIRRLNKSKVTVVRYRVREPIIDLLKDFPKCIALLFIVVEHNRERGTALPSNPNITCFVSPKPIFLIIFIYLLISLN